MATIEFNSIRSSKTSLVIVKRNVLELSGTLAYVPTAALLHLGKLPDEDALTKGMLFDIPDNFSYSDIMVRDKETGEMRPAATKDGEPLKQLVFH